MNSGNDGVAPTTRRLTGPAGRRISFHERSSYRAGTLRREEGELQIGGACQRPSLSLLTSGGWIDNMVTPPRNHQTDSMCTNPPHKVVWFQNRFDLHSTNRFRCRHSESGFTPHLRLIYTFECSSMHNTFASVDRPYVHPHSHLDSVSQVLKVWDHFSGFLSLDQVGGHWTLDIWTLRDFKGPASWRKWRGCPPYRWGQTNFQLRGPCHQCTLGQSPVSPMLGIFCFPQDWHCAGKPL